MKKLSSVFVGVIIGAILTIILVSIVSTIYDKKIDRNYYPLTTDQIIYDAESTCGYSPTRVAILDRIIQDNELRVIPSKNRANMISFEGKYTSSTRMLRIYNTAIGAYVYVEQNNCWKLGAWNWNVDTKFIGPSGTYQYVDPDQESHVVYIYINSANVDTTVSLYEFNTKRSKILADNYTLSNIIPINEDYFRLEFDSDEKMFFLNVQGDNLFYMGIKTSFLGDNIPNMETYTRFYSNYISG